MSSQFKTTPAGTDKSGRLIYIVRAEHNYGNPEKDFYEMFANGRKLVSPHDGMVAASWWFEREGFGRILVQPSKKKVSAVEYASPLHKYQLGQYG